MKKMKILSVLAPLFLLSSTLSMTGCRIKGLGSADTYDLDVTIDTRGAEIEFWTGFGDPYKGYIEELAEDFEALTGIKVVHTSKGGYDNLQDAINLSATTSSFPNLALGYPDHYAGYINSNIVLRLDGLIENDSKRQMVGKDEEGFDVDAEGIRRLNYGDFYSDYTTENENLEFKKDGSGYVIGLPFNKSTETMVYNAQFFDWCKTQNDLKDTIYVPTTWQQVKSVGLAIKNYFASKNIWGKALYSNGVVSATDPKDGSTLVLDAKDITAENFRVLSYDSTENLIITLIRQYGGVFSELDKTQTGVGYATFASAENKAKTLAAMSMWRELDELGIVGIPASFKESSFCTNAFLKSQTLMNIGSTAGTKKNVGGFKVGVAPIPQNANSESKYVISQGTNIGMFNKGTEKERVAAWKFMIYITQQRNGWWSARSGYFPTCDAATFSQDYVDYLENAVAPAEKAAQDSALVNTLTYGDKSKGWVRFVDPAFLGSSKVRKEAGKIPGFIMFEQATYPTDEAILEAVYTAIGSDLYKL